MKSAKVLVMAMGIGLSLYATTAISGRAHCEEQLEACISGGNSMNYCSMEYKKCNGGYIP